MIVRLTRLYHFNAAHRLFNPERDDAWNRRVFGKCANPDGHGHNYELEVTLRGEPDADSGLLYPLAELDAQIGELVLEPFDHQNLNEVLPRDAGRAPTSEVFVVEIWNRLIRGLEPRALERLWKLRLHETPRNSFDFPR